MKIEIEDNDSVKTKIYDCGHRRKEIFLITFETGDIWKVCAKCSIKGAFSRFVKSKEVIKN